MDEIRIEANERFDLVDMNRFKAFIREAFSDVFGDLLGNQFETFGAAEDNQKRPLVSRVCRTTKTAALQLTVWRQWSAGGQTYKAAIWDKDGYRITGPNSAASKSLTVALEPTGDLRYIQIRRVATEGTLETRRFYSDSGKYTQNINTQTIDDWEIQENVDSARESATLATAGWIDIATFRTEGEESSISEVTAIAAPWAQEPLHWDSIGGVGPAIENVGSLLFGLFQIVSRMRAGTDGRDALYDPRFDAAFEKEGGIRYAQGATSTIGLRDVYERLTACGDVIVAQPNTVADSDDLHHYRARGFVSGGLDNNGRPDPENRVGFCYARDVDIPTGNALRSISKPWIIHPASYWPTADNIAYTPWASIDNEWSHNFVTTSAEKFMSWWSNLDGSAYETTGLIIPLHVPHLCRIDEIRVHIKQIEAFDATEYFIARVYKKAVNSDTVSVVLGGHLVTGSFTDVYSLAGAWSPGVGIYGFMQWQPDILDPGYVDFIPDNSTYDYWMSIHHGVLATVVDKKTFLIKDTVIHTAIREASHVY